MVDRREQESNTMTKQLQEWLDAEDYAKVLKHCNQSKSPHA